MKIKICGITCSEDAQVAVAAGADLLGLNFFAGSRRCVGVDPAREVRAAAPASVMLVGVFVNAAVDEIVRTCGEVGLDGVQLHGDEPPEAVAELRRRGVPRVIRALRCGKQNLDDVAHHLEACRAAGCLPDLLLLDADVAGSFGGTGQPAPWAVIASHYDYARWPPLLLAGGLTPENVAEAIRVVRPWGVDVASGVERAGAANPPRKDADKVAAFVRAARTFPPQDGVSDRAGLPPHEPAT